MASASTSGVGGGQLGLTVAVGRYAGSSATAATLGWSKGRTDLRMSYVDESGTIMGTPTGDGAGWSVEGYGSMGITRLKIDSLSLVTGSTGIVGSRIGLQTTGPMFGGLLSFGIAQPLTVEGGAARLTYGSGYDLASRSLTYSTTDARLAGTRRLQLTAGFAKGGPRSSFRMGVMQDVIDGSVRALASYGMRF